MAELFTATVPRRLFSSERKSVLCVRRARYVLSVRTKRSSLLRGLFHIGLYLRHANERGQRMSDQLWKNAAITIPGVLYWASGSAPADKRWSPMHPDRSLYRPAPGPLPRWAEADYVSHNIAEFQRTGFHGGLNYYRAFEPYFNLSAAYKGAKIFQPSFYISGKSDGLDELYPLSEEQIRSGLPGLVGMVQLDNVGHWVQHEASGEVSNHLLKFLRTVNPD